MSRTERRGYRTAKGGRGAAGGGAPPHRKPRPSAYAKRSFVQWKADEEELAAARAGYHKARSRWRVTKVRRGDAREMCFVAKIARSSDCCVPQVVCGFRFCGTDISASLFFKKEILSVVSPVEVQT